MKTCALCPSPAKIFCEADQASLCWDCDAKVHSANFLVARHSRRSLCHLCQTPTMWVADGTHLGQTVSVCNVCAGKWSGDEKDEDSVERGNEEDEDDFDTDVESEYEEGFSEYEDEDNQVVPLSSSSRPRPLPTSSSSSSDDDEASIRSDLSRAVSHVTDLDSDVCI